VQQSNHKRNLKGSHIFQGEVRGNDLVHQKVVGQVDFAARGPQTGKVRFEGGANAEIGFNLCAHDIGSQTTWLNVEAAHCR